MLLQNVNNYILCRVFPTTLMVLTQKWYQRLPMGSIESFDQLASSFKEKFINCIPPRKLSYDLRKVKQMEGESFHDYISTFNAKAIQIKNLNHEIACEALKKGSRNVKFIDSLIKNLAWDYQQLMERAPKYVRLDDE
ncbi:hypothetical protein P3X46_012205 [Hevea brasiliensis]|uniref:Retrotransposon gag domain-containing protein n=1 Tax=Hevea brasiliensis TaxID=3981 RepID=A0ABQ9MD65_HEVBR|nr:hypothetical protein P3X46_012205 [Hevea brasiliensis]